MHMILKMSITRTSLITVHLSSPDCGLVTYVEISWARKVMETDHGDGKSWKLLEFV